MTTPITVTIANEGSVGPQGPQGPKGDKGDTGAQGPAGTANLTSSGIVTALGYTPVTPSQAIAFSIAL